MIVDKIIILMSEHKPAGSVTYTTKLDVLHEPVTIFDVGSINVMEVIS